MGKRRGGESMWNEERRSGNKKKDQQKQSGSWRERKEE